MAEEDVVAAYERLAGEQRALEQAIAAVVEELTSGANPAGLSGPLVDADGFPRADIDVHRARQLRHAFAVHQTDHRTVMRRIEEILPLVFAAKAKAKADAEHHVDRRADTDESPAAAAVAVGATKSAEPETAPAKEIDAADRAKPPFAVVQSVQTDSPADAAGLHAADQVLAFGTADATNHRGLEAIKEIVMHNIGSPIRVLVRRAAQEVPEWSVHELLLTPQHWRGPGVLGCLLMPLQDSEP